MDKSPGYWLQGALFVIAAFLLGQWVETRMDAHAFQSRATALLESWLGSSRESSADPSASRSRAEARRTGVVGRLAIPRLGIAAMVGEGVDERTLDRAIGHLPGTSFPGEQGNVGLAGHRDTFLRKLGGIERGDRIELQTADGSFDYVVVKTGVFPPSAIHLLDDTGSPLLTIVTCYPFHAIGPAPDRFVVRAVPGSARPARSSRT
jgi:sortase A